MERITGQLCIVTTNAVLIGIFVGQNVFVPVDARVQNHCIDEVVALDGKNVILDTEEGEIKDIVLNLSPLPDVEDDSDDDAFDNRYPFSDSGEYECVYSEEEEPDWS